MQSINPLPGTEGQTYLEDWTILQLMPWRTKSFPQATASVRLKDQKYYSGESMATALSTDQERLLDETVLHFISEFASKLLNRAKPLDREYAELLNKHFWDLLM